VRAGTASAVLYDLNSSSYCCERSCDELGHKLRKLNFAIEPGKTPKRATKQRCEKNSRDDKTAIELFLTGIWGWEAGLRRKLEIGKSG
jgi:hypothetical protein